MPKFFDAARRELEEPAGKEEGMLNRVRQRLARWWSDRHARRERARSRAALFDRPNPPGSGGI